jgi:hypothetical protein
MRCSEFLRLFFTSDNKAGQGTIEMGTVHWSKGLEADDVYILQPNTLPLAERIALGGWQKTEELCIQACSTLNPNPSSQPTTQPITSNLPAPLTYLVRRHHSRAQPPHHAHAPRELHA